MIPTTKNEFRNTWGNGYTETWAYDATLTAKLPALIREHKGKAELALEIGCGSGEFTSKWLAPVFKRVVALDYLSAIQHPACNITYVEIGDMDYTCAGQPDSAFDFVYSHGVFCHLTLAAQSTYLKAAYRVLKPGSKALVMFADFKRFPGASHTGWYYCDMEVALAMVKDAGFSAVIDAVPGTRDAILLMTK